MESRRPLRGGCQCGRNRYIIDIPEQANDAPQVLFNADSLHQVPLATPLAAFLRVPLSWYRSTTQSFFPDETHAMIHRVFEGQTPLQRQTKRYFCGFCGTPLSYWTERPHTEADFIQLTLASLRSDDLRDLEEMGLIPGVGDAEQASSDVEIAGAVERNPLSEASRGVSWFNSMVEGSRLGSLRRTQCIDQSRDGRTRTEWEIIEWTEGDGDDGDDDNDRILQDVEEDDDVEMTSNTSKRKMRDRGDSDVAADRSH